MSTLERTVLICGLGVTQVIGYGTLYYAFAVLAPDMSREFGWSSAWTMGALAVGLLARGFTSPAIGRMVDRAGAGQVMTAGSALTAAALALVALLPGGFAFYVSFALLHIVSTAVFYDAAFAALTQVMGSSARRSITQLTLIGGFASTIFWPITSLLHAHMDWRQVFLVYAVLNLVICLPLHHLLLSHRTRPSARDGASTRASEPSSLPPPLSGAARRRAFVLLAAAFSLAGFAISAMSVQMLSMLQTLGLSASSAVVIGAMVGPSQVAGRLGELFGGRGVHPLKIARVSFALMPLGFVALILGGSSIVFAGAFAILYGVSLGLNSILRGTVPLTLFGAEGYGAMMGRLATPGLVVTAVAPLAFGLISDAFGVVANLILATLVSTLAAIAILLIRIGPTRSIDADPDPRGSGP